MNCSLLWSKPVSWPGWWLTIAALKQWFTLGFNQQKLDVLTPCLILLAACYMALCRRDWRMSGPWLAISVALLLWPGLSAAVFCGVVLAALNLPKASAQQRRGGLVSVMVAVHSVWQSYGFEWLAAPLLACDAWLVSQGLSLLGYSMQQQGSWLALGPHALLVLRGCSSFSGLTLIILAWLAACLVHEWRVSNPIALTRLMAVLAISVLGNLIRLGAMALDADIYALLHEGTTAAAYQWLLLLVCGYWLLHDAKAPLLQRPTR